MSSAIRVQGDFQYDSVPGEVATPAGTEPDVGDRKDTQKSVINRMRAVLKGKKEAGDTAIDAAQQSEEAIPFALRGIDLTIPKGEDLKETCRLIP